MQKLLDDGIATRRGVMNAHREPAYPVGSWRSAPGGLEESERASAAVLVLPLFHQLTLDDQDRVVDALSHACR
jgi:dTDP-4-amino-4,6-dideoxygalactose transaminase